MARRLRSGDVLEVEFPKVPSPEVAWPDGGYGYLTYVGKHRNGVDAVRIRPGILYERPPITEELFKDSYICTDSHVRRLEARDAGLKSGATNLPSRPHPRNLAITERKYSPDNLRSFEPTESVAHEAVEGGQGVPRESMP